MERYGEGNENMVKLKLYTLEGKLLSPLVTSTTLIKKGKIWIRVLRDLKTNEKPFVSYIGKLVKGIRKSPNQEKSYRGFIRVTVVDHNDLRAKKYISNYLKRDYIGKRVNEGFGKVKWLFYSVKEYQKTSSIPKNKKFKIRKGLGPNCPKELQRLLIALMLHDFVKTEKHPSKIFKEITIEDKEIREACLNHHNGTKGNNTLLPLVKYFDQMAACICRKSVYKTKGRYDYENGLIDFTRITKEIEERQHSAYKLYNYIYQSKELKRIVESMTFGGKSLRIHLLLMVNLAINSYYNKWL